MPGRKQSLITHVACRLQKCTNEEDIRRIHSLMVGNGLDSNTFLCSYLIRLFASLGALFEANRIFLNVAKPCIYSWSASISANAKLGEGQEALSLHNIMQSSGVKKNKYTYVASLKACIGTFSLIEGRLIHQQIIQQGLELDDIIGCTLVDMYAKCGSLEDAKKTFLMLQSWDLLSWGAILVGYVQHGQGLGAIEIFDNMQKESVEPDNVIFSIVLNACGSVGSLEKGRLIHDQILELECLSSTIVGSALVNMYAKCGSLEEARQTFEVLPNRNVISWNTMIEGYAQHGDGLPALEMFEKMQKQCIEKTKETFLSVLKACSSIGAVEQGTLTHDQIVHNGFVSDTLVANTLVDMYAKCGSLERAHDVFDKLPVQDIVSWNALIAGYAQYGRTMLADQCLKKMKRKGIIPNEATFTSILVACCHTGFVDEGYHYFKSMRDGYGVVPDIQHYTCLADLLGRAGHLNKADHLLQVTLQPDIVGWTTLLGASRIYGDMELGGRTFKEVFQLDQSCTAGFVLMSNIFADTYSY